MTLFETGDGNTPLSPEEQAELIPDLTTKDELNEWERLNILQAFAWALHPAHLQRNDPLTEAYVRGLHQRMFDQTWKWAGRYRSTEKNIGIPHFEIREALPALLGDVRYWIEHQTFPPDTIALCLHHRLVFIHPFANGNGRHARLIADVIIQRMGRPAFSWGSASIAQAGDFRRAYIHALQAADKHDLRPLLAFARA